MDQALKTLAISCLDFTSLGDNDTEDNARILCQQAVTPLGNVAAVCLWPQFVDFAKRELADPSIDIATVVNFPSGEQTLDAVIADTKDALFAGADEIDLVFPYKLYLAGDNDAALNYVTTIKDCCGDKLLKVILETGELADKSLIRAVSTACLEAGADFLKTSTGKTKTGATLEAATEMLHAIKDFQQQHDKILGFKASGGIRTQADATAYIHLAQNIMGKDWLSARTFRIGASSLLQAMLSK